MLPSSHTYPASQSAHTVLPVAALNWPGLQTVQLVDSVALAKYPFEQRLHAEKAPSVPVKRPLAHGKHELCPDPVEYRPLLQNTHAAAAEEEKVPAMQLLHEADDAKLYRPALQSTQALAPEALLYWPAAHAMQSSEPVSSW
jgi:hypothetical protein